MKHQGVEIVCPACRGEMTPGADSLRCASCPRDYPVLAGIPDLRLEPDPYIGLEADRKKGLDLLERSAGLGFEETVDLYYRLTREVTPAQAAQFRAGLLAATARADETLSRWEREAGAGTGDLLDVGCGTAALLVAVARRVPGIVVGVDIAFRWLVVAKKRLEEAGLAAPLFCAGAGALPFPDGTFERLCADSVIEHVGDQATALYECHRVLRDGGRLFVSTPNRFSLGPDPHVPIWFGGLLPERLIAAYVRSTGGIPPRRHLLSSRELRELVARAGFDGVRVLLPDVPAAQRAQFGALAGRLVDVYQTAKRLPAGAWLLTRVGPVVQIVSTRHAARKV